MLDDTIRAAIHDAEAQRAKALVTQDFAALQLLFHEALVHIHTSGQVETKAQIIATARDRLRFLSVDRRTYDLRRVGDAVIAVGEVDQRIQVRATGQEIPMAMVTTQVWVPTPVAWAQIHYHATLRKS